MMTRGKKSLRLSLEWVCAASILLTGDPSSALGSGDFEVQPDAGDFVTLGFGGGEAGAEWTEIRVQGDGAVSYKHADAYGGVWPQGAISREHRLHPLEAKSLLQTLVNAGLFKVRTRLSHGPDIERTRIEASIDGHALKAEVDGTYFGGLDSDQEWGNLIRPFEWLQRRIHPERWHVASDLVIPDRSTPERTLRTFWWAIGNQEREVALGCVDRKRVAAGRHGRDVNRFISEHAATDTSEFRFLVGGNRISIESPHHMMDYELEQRGGKWVIISIHP